IDGTGTDVIYNVGVRIRGSGSRQRAVPNFRVGIPSDRAWQGVSAVNLNTQYPHSQMAGMNIFELAGLAFEEPTAVQVRVNGENRAVEQNVQFGSYGRMEVVGSEWVNNHYPKDADGNFYRGSSTLSYLGEDQNNYIDNGGGGFGNNTFNKQTNSGDRGINAAGQTQTTSATRPPSTQSGLTAT
ncbi:MAG: hypothetical protein WD875_04700, partial [Pirellulales bacterium]